MTCDMENTLENKTKEELIAECERREKVAHAIWAAIVLTYGPEGFTKVLNNMKGGFQ